MCSSVDGKIGLHLLLMSALRIAAQGNAGQR